MTRGEPGDDERARELVASALDLTRADLPALAERAGHLMGKLGVTLSTVLRTFMFTDIVGSTALVDAIGDEAWEQLRRWHDEMIESCISTHHGELVNRMGDGFFVAFNAPRRCRSVGDPHPAGTHGAQARTLIRATGADRVAGRRGCSIG